MNRRDAVGLLLASAIVSSGAVAQVRTAQKPARVGVIASKVDAVYRGAFTSALQELGWIEGRNLTIDWRAPEIRADIPLQAAELVRLRPDVIVTAGPRITEEMAKLAPGTPIVFLAVANPVKLGLVRSLPFPGGNVTGFMTGASDGYPGKLLELLKEAVPGTTRMGVLIAADNNLHQSFVELAKPVVAPLRVSLMILSARTLRDIETAFETAGRERLQALVVPGDLLFSTNRDRIATLALQMHLATMFMFPYYVESGGLMAYGVSVEGLYRNVARSTDKILRGTPPRDIPVEQPTRFDLMLNMKTARALGLAIPPSVLVRVDKVID